MRPVAVVPVGPTAIPSAVSLWEMTWPIPPELAVTPATRCPAVSAMLLNYGLLMMKFLCCLSRDGHSDQGEVSITSTKSRR